MSGEAESSVSKREEDSGKPRPPKRAGRENSLRIESDGGERPVMVGMKTWRSRK